ncbi:MAG: sigma-70 family RNA polymerase sigma factor [Marinifilum sp.]|jgi:RNA polymerase sigma-70 factor (ECF subfamily)|nr:sigma-70 family RNA polymerase sigma factor [Marinifilum sp.]
MKLTNKHITQLTQGNLNAFNEIYNGMFHSLCLFGFKMIPEDDVVNDAVQEVFVELWRRREQFTTLIKTKAYLYTSVRNKILTHISSKRTVSIETAIYDEVEVNNYITAEETHLIIQQAVKKLPLQSRKIIDLNLAGYGNQEIANELGISINTVKTLKKSGYAKLRISLKENLFVLLVLSELLA